MAKSTKGGRIILGVVILLAALLWAESTNHILGRWVASTIYDDHANFLSCAELPSLASVEQVMSEHQDLIRQIVAIRPELINVSIDPSCPGKGILVIEYASHADRMQIEALIGDTFFGIPWKGINT